MTYDRLHVWKMRLTGPAAWYMLVCLYIPAFWIIRETRNRVFSLFDIPSLVIGGLILLLMALPLIVVYLLNYLTENEKKKLRDRIDELEGYALHLEPYKHKYTELTNPRPSPSSPEP